jgi:hypothetical protein
MALSSPYGSALGSEVKKSASVVVVEKKCKRSNAHGDNMSMGV